MADETRRQLVIDRVCARLFTHGGAAGVSDQVPRDYADYASPPVPVETLGVAAHPFDFVIDEGEVPDLESDWNGLVDAQLTLQIERVYQYQQGENAQRLGLRHWADMLRAIMKDDRPAGLDPTFGGIVSNNEELESNVGQEVPDVDGVAVTVLRLRLTYSRDRSDPVQPAV